MKQSVIDSSFLRGAAALGRASLEPASYGVKLAQRYHKGPRRHDEQQQSGRRLLLFQCKVEERGTAREKHDQRKGRDWTCAHPDIDVALNEGADGIYHCFATPAACQSSAALGSAAGTNAAVTVLTGPYGIGLRMVETLHRQPPNRPTTLEHVLPIWKRLR